jgi:hypothetical protein
MRIEALAFGLAISWAALGVARATEVQFTIKGGDPTTTFELSTTSGHDEGVFFFFPSVLLTVGGAPPTSVSLTFWSEELGGGFSGGLFDFTNVQPFYSGPESSPTFATQAYPGLLNTSTGKTDTVTVTELSTAPPPPALSVPEPSTWAMLLLGFVGLSYAGYRKARTRTAPAARPGSLPTSSS